MLINTPYQVYDNNGEFVRSGYCNPKTLKSLIEREARMGNEVEVG